MRARPTGAAQERAKAASGQFDPFRHDPERAGGKYARSAAKAAQGSYREAIRLACLQCIGWDPGEAEGCTAPHCGLWIANRKIFGGGADVED